MLFVIVVDNQVRPIADRPPHTETKRSIALEQIHMSANDSSKMTFFREKGFNSAQKSTYKIDQASISVKCYRAEEKERNLR